MQSVLNEVDVERYAREGYLTAPSVLSPAELALLREAADEILALCAQEPERHARRINGRPITSPLKTCAAWIA